MPQRILLPVFIARAHVSILYQLPIVFTVADVRPELQPCPKLQQAEPAEDSSLVWEHLYLLPVELYIKQHNSLNGSSCC